MVLPDFLVQTDNIDGVTPGRIAGGSFSVDHDGAASYVLPLWAPTGKRHIQPELVLGLLVHDLRRSAVRNFREAGVAQSTIMAISGHKTEEVFRRYSINSREDIRRAMQRVQAASKVVDVQNSLALNGESLGRVKAFSKAKLLRAHSSVG